MKISSGTSSMYEVFLRNKIKELNTKELEDLKYWILEYTNFDCGSDVLGGVLDELSVKLDMEFTLTVYRGIAVGEEYMSEIDTCVDGTISAWNKEPRDLEFRGDYDSFSSDLDIAVYFAEKNIEDEREVPVIIETNSIKGVYIPVLAEVLNIEDIPGCVSEEEEYFVRYKEEIYRILT